MTRLTANLKPVPLDDVRTALRTIGAQGSDRPSGYTELVRVVEPVIDSLPKIRPETALHEQWLDCAIAAIMARLETGSIRVYQLAQVCHTRTGEADAGVR